MFRRSNRSTSRPLLDTVLRNRTTQNTPVLGFAMWSTVRGEAGMCLPDPRAALG
ncbi:hypothetical protein AB0J48_03535 [Nocardia salmonicida]|uniref:hypothetical protein n=1 Tax=Nocardia salmonicida TaxID=53431 RepID=UPI003443D084